MAVLVFGAPAPEADHQHSKRSLFGPESVLDSGLDQELVVGLRMVDLTIQLQVRPVVEEVKQLIANLVRVQAGAMAGPHECQIDRALLVAHHHVDVAPGPLGLDCLFSVPWVH